MIVIILYDAAADSSNDNDDVIYAVQFLVHKIAQIIKLHITLQWRMKLMIFHYNQRMLLFCRRSNNKSKTS